MYKTSMYPLLVFRGMVKRRCHFARVTLVVVDRSGTKHYSKLDLYFLIKHLHTKFSLPLEYYYKLDCN